MKFRLVIVLSILWNVVCMAQGIVNDSIEHKAKLEDIKKLFDPSLLRENGIVETEKKTLSDFPESYKKIYSEILFNEFKDISASIYDRSWTHDEIKEIIKFHETPFGRKYGNFVNEYRNDIFSEVQDILQKVHQKTFERYKHEGNDISKLPNAQVPAQTAEDTLDQHALVPVDKQPVPVKQVAPEYPEVARRAGVVGTVWVKILVNKEGKAEKVVIMKSDSEIFNDAALAAAKQWVFTPATLNNGPVEAWAVIPFRFRLNK